MSINPQAHGHNMFDVLEGSVSNHFAQIESVLLKNECINGQYNLITAASYASNTPVDTPGFTKVCFSTNGSNIADLENSYIEADIDYILRYTGIANFDNALIPNHDKSTVLANSTKFSKFFIGFKQSLDALERYDIYCNSQLIYSQPFVGPESTVLLAGINDTIRENSPFVYTSFHNASTMDANVCGVYVDLGSTAQNTDFTVKIPVKINLHQFLLLSPIHYLPSFCGRWEIQLYFGSKNLVMCPVNPAAYFQDKADISVYAGLVNAGSGNAAMIPNFIERNLDEITHFMSLDTETHDGTAFKCNNLGWSHRFTQINTPMCVYNGVDDSELKFDKITFSCSKAKLEKCLMNLTQFQLKFEIYQALMMKYTENPLIIPTNTLSYQRFAHSSSPGDGDLHAVANLPVENIDALYVLIPENDNQQTCFYQPYLTNVRMSLGEFGIRPQRHMDTVYTAADASSAWNNRRFITYLLDSLNLEDSQISAMNKDFSNSVLPHAIEYIGGVATPKFVNTNRSKKFYDDSHFMIGIPLSQVGFQSGTVSSPNTNINFQFDANKIKYPMTDGTVKYLAAGGVIVMFLTDAALMIQVQQNSDHPLVRLSSKSIV